MINCADRGHDLGVGAWSKLSWIQVAQPLSAGSLQLAHFLYVPLANSFTLMYLLDGPTLLTAHCLLRTGSLII